ncbi:MAG TPA: hypothetical protein VGI45_09030 [Terracidiphilus sp.]
MPDQQTINLLLQEFRDFRTEFNDFKSAVSTWNHEVGQRLTAVEVNVKAGITGNGQPSRLANLEREVDDLKQVRSDERIPALEKDVDGLQHVKWKASGIAIGIIAVIDIAAKFIPQLIQKLFS